MNQYQNDQINGNCNEESIDLKKHLKRFFELWPWFLVSIIVALSLAFLVNKIAPQAYSVSSTVLIKDEKGYRKSNNLVSSLDVFDSQVNLQNEIGIIRSYNLNHKTVEDLGLYITYHKFGKYRERDIYKNHPFVVIPDTSHYQAINVQLNISLLDNSKIKIECEQKENFAAIKYSTGEILNFSPGQICDSVFVISPGELFETPFFSFRVFPAPGYNEIPSAGEYYVIFHDISAMAASYRSRVSAEPINDESSIVRVSLIDPIPSRALDYVNMLVTNYINLGLFEKNLIATKTIDFIDQQLLGITDTLSTIEKDLAKFRTENSIVDLSTQGQAIFQKIQTLEYEKSMEQMKVGYYKYLLTYVQNDSLGNDLIAPSAIGIDDPLLTQLIGELAQLYATREQIRATSTARNPYLQEINVKIDALRRSIIENVSNILTNAKFSLSEKQKELNRVQVELQSLPETERKLIGIERMFTVNDQIYTFLLEKRAEAAISRASNIADHKIIDKAWIDGRIKPKTKQNFLIALIIGILLPALIIFVLDKIKNSIKDIHEVESLTNIPILGSILHNNDDTVHVQNISMQVLESFRAIRTNLDFFVANQERKIITVTSINPGEGKSFCSMHLANVFALAGKKTLIIGADIRKPDLGKYFNLHSDSGLSAFLSHNVQWSKAVVKSVMENLDVLPAGQIPPNPAELLSAENVTRVFANLEKYDIVIFDTSPIGVIADAAYIIRKADINLFITRFKRTTRQDIKLINQIVFKLAVKNAAIVCNDQKYKGNKYSYYYYYGGSKKR
jgi:tyrosine-protein kinase Etk/Wzc